MLLTIGTATNAQYYVEIEATVSGGSLEFSWCIYGDTRRELEARALDCRSRGDGEAPIGTLRGVAIGGSVDAQPTPGELNGSNLDLSQLSADELKELINNAVEELSRR
jgi:hypothetical protein